MFWVFGLKCLWYYLTNSYEYKVVHAFPKSINPKANIIERREFELASFDSTIQHFNHNPFQEF